MTTLTSMKAYQASLSEQLKDAAMTETTATMLGVAIGENRYLVHMNEVGEVIQIPKFAPVSLTQAWFLGMANVRGNLYGITDLSIYWGGEPIPIGIKARILLVAPHYRINSGILVSSMLGIRSLSDFELATDISATAQSGISGHYKDKEGRLWHALNLQEIVMNETFLKVAIKSLGS